MFLFWLALAVVSLPQASSCTCQHTVTRSMKRRQRKGPDTLRGDGKAMTGGESQKRKGELSASLNCMCDLSCTAGGHLKEMEGVQGPTDIAHITCCLYRRMYGGMWRNMPPMGTLLHPASIKPFGLGGLMHIVINYQTFCWITLAKVRLRLNTVPFLA